MKRALLALAFTLAVLLPRCAAGAPASTADPWLWLEDVSGKRAVDWVERQDRKSVRDLASSREFKSVESRLLDVLNSDTKIPYVSKIGDLYYNVWRDAKHPRGLWRRTTPAAFSPSPAAEPTRT